jgi:hypothetical protein
MFTVLTSATYTQLEALFHNDRHGVPLWTTLIKMGHPQGPTPIQTGNACADVIINETVKQIRCKSIAMRFYWIRNRIHQRQIPRAVALSY